MKSLISILVLFLAFSPPSSAQDSALTSAIELLPQCAISCLTTALAGSTCALTDQKCICADTQLQSGVEVCVLSTCTIKEALTTKNLTTTTCNAPIRDRTQDLRVMNITTGVLSASFVLMRIFYKLFFCITELGWDDYMVLATVVSGVPSTIITDRGTTANGLGRDIWTVPFDQITNFVRWFYVMEVLYFLQLTLLKLSLLFFFLRIFPSTPARRILWMTVVFDILYGIAFVLAAIFQCKPISFYWTLWDGEHKGQCIDINALGWANAAISIFLDFWMLGIPLSQVIHLKLAWKKKVGVTLMFCVGTFVTVVSILRLQSLVHFAKSTNPTWDQWDVVNWSTIEINVGIMCACMPSMRIILVRLFPKVLGSSKGSSKQYSSNQKYGSKSRGFDTGASNSSGMGSQLGQKGVVRRERTVITIKKTFEVEHYPENDEEVLVPMENLEPRPTRPTKMRSHSLSEISL